MYLVGGRTFRRKSNVSSFAYGILAKYSIGDRIIGNDAEFLKNLCDTPEEPHHIQVDTHRIRCRRKAKILRVISIATGEQIANLSIADAIRALEPVTEIAFQQN